MQVNGQIKIEDFNLPEDMKKMFPEMDISFKKIVAAIKKIPKEELIVLPLEVAIKLRPSFGPHECVKPLVLSLISEGEQIYIRQISYPSFSLINPYY